MNKKTISIIFAYVGVLTGAGLASGQELCSILHLLESQDFLD